MSIKIVNKAGRDLAKDVLAQLRYQKIRAGWYFRETSDFYKLKKECPNASAQKHMKMIRECEVCAKGALVVAYVKRFNNISLDEIHDAAADGQRLAQTLAGFFDIEELDLIEDAFEGRLNDDNDIQYDFSSFKNNIRKDKHRLRLIMQNIVRNGGKFVPEKLIKQYGKEKS